MKFAAMSLLLVLFLLSSAVAQITPGVVIPKGEAFPIIADFNGDGLDDLIQERNVIINDGPGFTTIRDLQLPSKERVVAVLDVNGDGIPDLMTEKEATQIPATVDPSFQPGPTEYRLYIGNAARAYANGILIASGAYPPPVADADGDGKDDLLIMAPVRDGFRDLGTDVTVLRSRGDGTFEHLAPFRIARAPQVWPDPRVLAADINHDGVPDLVIRCPEDLFVLRGTGGGHFVVDDYYLPENMFYGWWSTRLGDVDGDGNADIVMPGWRMVRVLFGDGHGKFARMATAELAKLHDGNWPVIPTDPERLNQPRDIALGHFTRSDQMQIAGATSEGDIIVISYENGSLKEVSRTATDFWFPDVRSGHFRNTRESDLYAMGTLIWGEQYPRPRVFYGNAPAVQSVAGATGGRGRARVSRPQAHAEYEMQAKGNCIDEATARWTLVRDGFFGSAQNADSTIQAVIDPPRLYFRLNAPYVSYPVIGELTDSGEGVYVGAVAFFTPCGPKSVMVTAAAR